MIEKLQDKIAQYINKTANLKNWQDIREKYFEYSYLAFMCLCANKLNAGCAEHEVAKTICDFKIENKKIVTYIITIPYAKEFIADTLELSKDLQTDSINSLYQEYLSRDYTVLDNKIAFNRGKNNRDVLGSYYTQEDFANEITRKAINDYLLNDRKSENYYIKIADYSCGGGAFLVSACRLCKEKNVKIKIYGYDVDPIAVLITKLRLKKEMGIDSQDISVFLGNPLIQKSSERKPFEMFKLAAIGRFYNSEMGISAVKDMDIILGNPPWEKIRFEEKKFLGHYTSTENIKTKAERKLYLESITKENKLFYNKFISDYNTAKKSIKEDSRFCYSDCGELNTYALFTELSLNSLHEDGITGLIVKTSLVKMPVYSRFFRTITKNKNLYELYMFVNRKKIFNIDSREEFSVIYLNRNKKNDLKLALNLDTYSNFYEKEKIELSYEVLNTLNPDTGMIPNISSQKELHFLTSVYKENQIFSLAYPKCKFGRLVHLTNHSSSIKKNIEEGYSPIYEGKFIEIYTGKYATFAGIDDVDKYKNKAFANNIENIDGQEYPQARFYIRNDVWNNLSKNFDDDFIVAWRSLTSATNRRTMLATILPLIPTCQSIQLLQLPKRDMLHILAVFNSIVFDYIARLKMAGLDLTQTIIKQIPVPNVSRFNKEIEFMGNKSTIEKHIFSRIKWLYTSDYRLENLFHDIQTYHIESDKTRKQVIAEIDKLIAIAYGIDDAMLKQIAMTFQKYYIKEEVEKWF